MTPIDPSAAVSPAHAEQPNRLAGEKSPYLLQHAHNPVDWYPWGEEAFAKARRENKPIFLSIGYSTCHWCHVMAHESFENDQVAAVMNREFVNIKLDREERPDVDRVYMTFVQATTGHGGWPMSVWLTPDLHPFVGGTYFPPEDRYGQSGFSKVLERIATAWKESREEISEQGVRIVEALRESQTVESSASEKISADILEKGYEQFSSTFDAKEGGFGDAPKFPRPVALNFLARYYARNVERASRLPSATNATETVAPQAERALDINLVTLRKMAAGGMHDHLGGGFHRYSVDRYWHVPHFEKMLYDQAQLAVAYLEAFQITHDAQFSSVARDTLDYVAREMTAKEGGFFSAEDADSLVPPVAAVYDRRNDTGEHKEIGADTAPLQKSEGAFYVWTKKEIDSVVGNAAEIFNFHYGVESHGNVRAGSDPQGEFRGKNVLFQRHTTSETAKHFSKTDAEIEKLLEESRQKLLSIRAKRPRPHLDDKILASWNGLMISAYARAAQILNEPRYLETATRAAAFVRAHLFEQSSKMLFRSYREGRGTVEGFADDYAFVIQASLDLYEASFDIEWLKFAAELQEIQNRLFWDQRNGGYFSTTGQDKNVVLRMKDDNDSAEPSASSVGALNLLRLGQIQNDPKLQERAEKTIAAFSPTLTRFASAMPQMLVAVDFSLAKPRQIVIAGPRDAAGTKVLLAEVHRHFLPNKVLLLVDGSEGQKYLGETNEAIRAMAMVDNKPAAFVCENFTCQAPVTDPEVLGLMLSN